MLFINLYPILLNLRKTTLFLPNKKVSNAEKFFLFAAVNLSHLCITIRTMEFSYNLKLFHITCFFLTFTEKYPFFLQKQVFYTNCTHHQYPAFCAPTYRFSSLFSKTISNNTHIVTRAYNNSPFYSPNFDAISLNTIAFSKNHSYAFPQHSRFQGLILVNIIIRHAFLSSVSLHSTSL